MFGALVGREQFDRSGCVFARLCDELVSRQMTRPTWIGLDYRPQSWVGKYLSLVVFGIIKYYSSRWNARMLHHHQTAPALFSFFRYTAVGLFYSTRGRNDEARFKVVEVTSGLTLGSLVHFLSK